MKKDDDIQSVQEEIGQKVEDVNILFLDLSSTCTGYSKMSLNFADKTATMTSCGSLWLDKKDWKDQQKYSYMFNCIANYFWIIEGIDYIVLEQYSVNPKKMAGVLVLPEITGVVKAAAEENGVKVSSILPQTWRSHLKIKPIVTKKPDGKSARDFKEPTKNLVNSFYDIPERTVSNITGIERTTPSDLYDAVAIGLGWCSKLGINVIHKKEFAFNSHIGHTIGENK